jgi:hypothetical protein
VAGLWAGKGGAFRWWVRFVRGARVRQLHTDVTVSATRAAEQARSKHTPNFLAAPTAHFLKDELQV